MYVCYILTKLCWPCRTVQNTQNWRTTDAFPYRKPFAWNPASPREKACTTTAWTIFLRNGKSKAKLARYTRNRKPYKASSSTELLQCSVWQQAQHPRRTRRQCMHQSRSECIFVVAPRPQLNHGGNSSNSMGISENRQSWFDGIWKRQVQSGDFSQLGNNHVSFVCCSSSAAQIARSDSPGLF